MTVVAKFYVQNVEKPEGTSAAARVTLGAVCRGIENASWSSATPSGTITLGILNDAATDQFEPGAEYLVTFQRVEKPMPGDGHQPKPLRTKHGYFICETCGGFPKTESTGTYDPDYSKVTVADLDWTTHHEVFDTKPEAV